MKFSRLVNPEHSPVHETGRGARLARTIGGYALGFMGYATGVGAITNTLVTGGLSLPVLGGMSGAFFAGSRALLRPVYQDNDDYEPVKAESKGEKATRIASFIGGFAVANIGINLLTAGLFNGLEGLSMGVPGRIGATISGLIGTVVGTNVVRGSFDPKLHADTADTDHRSTGRTIKASFLEGWDRVRQENRASRELANRQIAKHRLLGEEYKLKSASLVREFTDKLRSGEVNVDDFRLALDELTAEYTTKSQAIRAERHTAVI